MTIPEMLEQARTNGGLTLDQIREMLQGVDRTWAAARAMEIEINLMEDLSKDERLAIFLAGVVGTLIGD